jgi:hypothetical protein
MMHGERDEQLTPDESRAMAALRVSVDPSPELYHRVSAGLGRRGAFRRPVRRWLGPLAAAAAVVLAYMAGVRSSAVPAPATVPGPQYAFFLLNTPEARWPEDVSPVQIVEEFRSWAQPLATSGRLALADELAEEHQLVDQMTARIGDPAQGFNGFFVVSAPDDSAAIQLARTLPHVRQGGVVAVQRLMGR